MKANSQMRLASLIWNRERLQKLSDVIIVPLLQKRGIGTCSIRLLAKGNEYGSHQIVVEAMKPYVISWIRPSHSLFWAFALLLLMRGTVPDTISEYQQSSWVIMKDLAISLWVPVYPMLRLLLQFEYEFIHLVRTKFFLVREWNDMVVLP